MIKFLQKRFARLDKRRRFRIVAACVLFLIAAGAAVFPAAALDNFLSGASKAPEFVGFFDSIEILFLSEKARTIYLILVFMLLCGAVALVIVNPTPYAAEKIQITPDIEIPKKAGQGQHGTAWFMSEQERLNTFEDVEYSHAAIKDLVAIGKQRGLREAEIGKKIIDEIGKQNPNLKNNMKEGDNKGIMEAAAEMKQQPVQNGDSLPELVIHESFIKEAGLVINKTNTATGEKLTCVTADTHSLVIGMTRSGKTRCLVLQTAVALGLAGESMVFSDPKGELWAYLNPLLKALGYNVICLDFKNPLRSDRYNFLQPVIDYLLEGKPEKAEEAVAMCTG